MVKPVMQPVTPKDHLLNIMDLYRARRQFVMPVRSFTSSVLKWPDRETVDKAVRKWVTVEVRKHRELRRLGYFGSYAGDNWGVGSDLDLIAIVANASESFGRRNLTWNLDPLPVPTDLLIYTEEEWKRLHERGGKFIRTLDLETIWIYP